MKHLPTWLDALPEQPPIKDAIKLRYGVESPYQAQTFQSIGNHMGKTRERARQWVEKGLRMLRHNAYYMLQEHKRMHRERS